MTPKLPPLPGNPEPGSAAWMNAVAAELAASLAAASPRAGADGSFEMDVGQHRIVFHADRRVEVLPGGQVQPTTAKDAAIAEIAKMPLTDEEWILLYGLAQLLIGCRAGLLQTVRAIFTNAFRGDV